MTVEKAKKLKSLPEAADLLGVSVKCLRGWVWKRTIPYVKVGRCVRIAEQTILEIIERGTMPSLERLQ